MNKPHHSHAAPLLVVGCVVFGLGSLIVKFVEVGSYAIAFWRLAIAAVIFWLLLRLFGQKLPKSKKAIYTAMLSGVFLAFDLSLWHESIHAVGPGISTLLNSLQIFFLSAIGFFFFGERLSKPQMFSLILAISGVALIGSPEFGHNGNAVWGFISGITSGGYARIVYGVYPQNPPNRENFPVPNDDDFELWRRTITHHPVHTV